MTALATKMGRTSYHNSPSSLWGRMFPRGGFGSISPGLRIDYAGEISKDFVQETGDSRFAVTYLDNRLMRVIRIYPDKPKTRSVEAEFRTYAEKWYEEIKKENMLARMTGKASYLHIIGLEPKREVISLILNELKSKPAPWFLALKILSKNNEVGKAHAGNFNLMARDWLDWGRENRFI